MLIFERISSVGMNCSIGANIIDSAVCCWRAKEAVGSTSFLCTDGYNWTCAHVLMFVQYFVVSV